MHTNPACQIFRLVFAWFCIFLLQVETTVCLYWFCPSILLLDPVSFATCEKSAVLSTWLWPWRKGCRCIRMHDCWLTLYNAVGDPAMQLGRRRSCLTPSCCLAVICMQLQPSARGCNRLGEMWSIFSVCKGEINQVYSQCTSESQSHVPGKYKRD